MFSLVVTFLLLPAIFNAEEVDRDQASVRLLEIKLEHLYEEKGGEHAISEHEAKLSELYNLPEEEEARDSDCESCSERECHSYFCMHCDVCRYRTRPSPRPFPGPSPIPGPGPNCRPWWFCWNVVSLINKNTSTYLYYYHVFCCFVNDLNFL